MELRAEKITELDLALYRLKSQNSSKEHPIAEVLKTLFYVLLFQ
jgi:hypothetical protein